MRPEFSVTPAQLVLGEIAPGAQVTRKIVVRGKEPFKIVDVTCGEDCFEFKTDNDESQDGPLRRSDVPRRRAAGQAADADPDRDRPREPRRDAHGLGDGGGAGSDARRRRPSRRRRRPRRRQFARPRRRSSGC